MQNIYKKEFDLRTSDFDCRRMLLPSSILDLFQVVAGEHADELGCGVAALSGSKLLWVLVRTKYEVISQPKMFQRIVLKTWPLAPSRVGFQREYLMEDLSGNPLIKGSSDWVIIHSEKRRIVPAGNIYPEGMEYLSDKMFDEKLAKVSDFEAEGEGLSVCPGFSQLDMNGHVNNTKYANYAVDAFDPGASEVIGSFQIDYRHELQKGDNIKVFAEKTDDTVLVKGVSAGNDIMFACSIELR